MSVIEVKKSIESPGWRIPDTTAQLGKKSHLSWIQHHTTTLGLEDTDLMEVIEIGSFYKDYYAVSKSDYVKRAKFLLAKMTRDFSQDYPNRKETNFKKLSPEILTKFCLQMKF